MCVIFKIKNFLANVLFLSKLTAEFHCYNINITFDYWIIGDILLSNVKSNNIKYKCVVILI